MRLHDRYLFRELITPLAFCLGAFLVVGVSLFFKEELNTIQEHKLNLLETAAYCATSLPEFFVVVLPILLLLSMLYALTHHARHNELTALRAAGVSLWRLCAPYFVTGLVASAARARHCCPCRGGVRTLRLARFRRSFHVFELPSESGSF